LANNEDADMRPIGTYKPLTEKIAKNPKKYGSTKPITDKKAGKPYDMQWTGEMFKTLNAEYKPIGAVEVTAKGGFEGFMNRRPNETDNRYLDVQEKDRDYIEELVWQAIEKHLQSQNLR
jgi:hypothetical protein